MNDYIDFNRKYKDIILGKLTPDLYYDAKEYISDIIDEMVDMQVLKLEDLDKFTEFSMAYLFTRKSADRILKDNKPEEVMGDIVTSYIKYNEKNGIKASVDLSNIELPRKQRENSEVHKKEDESKKYIRTFLGKIKGIFKDGTDFNSLTNDVYESLLFDGYKDDEIVSEKADKTIINYIRNRYFDIEYTNEFNELFKYSKERTNQVFRKTEKNGEISQVEKSYFSGYSNLGTTAFKVALGLSIQGYDAKKASTSNIVDGYIQNCINSDIARINSIRSKQEKQLRKETRAKVVEDIKTDFKKKAIAFAIAFGIFAADNIIYNAFHNDKKEDTNKTKKEPTTYSVNGEYKPGSYLENIDWESIQRRSTGPSLEETLANRGRG